LLRDQFGLNNPLISIINEYDDEMMAFKDELISKGSVLPYWAEEKFKTK